METSAAKKIKIKKIIGLSMIFIGLGLSVLSFFFPNGHRLIVAKIGFLFWAPGVAILDKRPSKSP